MSRAGRAARRQASRAKAKDKGKAATASQGSQGNQATVQSRNAGASICSGLPQANPNPGGP